MKKYAFIILSLVFFFQSCQKDNEFATALEGQDIEQIVDTASDGTKIGGKFFEHANITEIVPQTVLDKLENNEPLTSEEQLNMDKVSFERITYQGQSHSLEEAYADAALMDVYFDTSIYTLIMNKDIYLFDTEEEVEEFKKQIINSRSTRFKFNAKFWDYEDFNGGWLQYWVNNTQTNRVGYMLPASWQNRASSVKIWDAKIPNRPLTSELKYTMIRHNDRLVVYPINYHNYYMQFSNFNELYPLNDPYQWNTSYNNAIIAFSIGIGSINSLYTSGDTNIFSLEGFIEYMIDLGLAGLEHALSAAINGHPDVSIVEAPYDLVGIRSVQSASRLKVRSESDSQVYVESTPWWSNRESWVPSNVMKNGEILPMYKLTNVVTKKNMAYSYPYDVVQASPADTDFQYWVFVKYHPFWKLLPEYQLVNVALGFYATRVDGTNHLKMKPSLGNLHIKQRWNVLDY